MGVASIAVVMSPLAFYMSAATLLPAAIIGRRAGRQAERDEAASV
ncbi:hypothetical protein [Brevundimonas sp.]